MPTTYVRNSRAAYQRAAVLTASQSQLIVMLYDGARRFLTQAATAMITHDIPRAHDRLRRAERIIAHLRATLAFDQAPEIAGNLNALYDFYLRHLNKARILQDPQYVNDVSRMLGALRDAWAQVDRQLVA